MEPDLTKLEIGSGRVTAIPDGWRLTLPATPRGYGDAQIDDTRGRRRSALLHHPPTRLALDARAMANPLIGTLGFGLWNDPFPAFGGAAGSDRWLPASPNALWFFGRWPPADLPFAAGADGTGWCAASIRTPRLPGLIVAALGAAVVVAAAMRPLRKTVWRSFWRRTSGHQHTLEMDVSAWHQYSIEWLEGAAEFAVDGALVLRVNDPPDGPLGLVIWIDNQWASFSEADGLGFGTVSTVSEAALEIRNLRLNGQAVEVR